MFERPNWTCMQMRDDVEVNCEFVSRTSDVFNPGEHIDGIIQLNITHPIQASELTISLVGKARTTWDSEFQQRILDSNGVAKATRPITCYDEVTYVNTSDRAWTPSEEQPVLIGGRHKLLFSFSLPNRCPPSFEAHLGNIRYYISLRLDGVELARKYFTVLPRIELARMHPSRMNVIGTVGSKVFCFCLPSRSVLLRCRLAKFGYVSGEELVVEVEIENRSKRDIQKIRISLVQTVTFVSMRDEYVGTSMETREQKALIAESESKVSVERGGFHQSAVSLLVPPVVPTFGESIIAADYHVKVVVTMASWRDVKYTCKLPVLIGTLPIIFAKDVIEPQLVGDSGSSPFVVEHRPAAHSHSSQAGPRFEPLYPYYSNLPATPDAAWLL